MSKSVAKMTLKMLQSWARPFNFMVLWQYLGCPQTWKSTSTTQFWQFGCGNWTAYSWLEGKKGVLDHLKRFSLW